MTFPIQACCNSRTQRRFEPRARTSLLFGVFMSNILCLPSTMVVVQRLASAPRLVDPTLWTYYLQTGLSIYRLLLDQACNGRDQLLNHLRFHYCMVLVCQICAGCESSSWRTVKGHTKACALQRPNIAG